MVTLGNVNPANRPVKYAAVALVTVVAVLALAGLKQRYFETDEGSASSTVSLQLTPPQAPATPGSPFGVVSDSEKASALPQANPSNQVDNNLTDSSGEPPLPVDVTVLGLRNLTETEMQSLLGRLGADPQLLGSLIDEMRQETDPERRKRLAQILGEVGGDSVMLLASEFIFSGDASSRELGLDLLQMVQPGNPQAREMVAGMLATEVEPRMLVNTLTTLAEPGDVDAQSRAYLSDQVAWLTDHADPGVRSISLDILSRWTANPQYTPVLLSGLDDESEHVRTSAAYALVSHEDQSPEVIDRLFSVIDNTSESKKVRRAAILALRNMPLSEEQQLILNTTERELNTVIR